MVFQGHVENGNVIVDGPTTPPEGARVEIHVVAQAPAAQTNAERPWLRFSGVIKDLTADASEQIDKVLYGNGEN